MRKEFCFKENMQLTDFENIFFMNWVQMCERRIWKENRNKFNV